MTMTTETNAERLARLKSNSLLLEYDHNLRFVFAEAERAQKLEAKVESLQVENGGLRELHERLEGMWLHEKRCLQEENARLWEMVKSLKLHAVHCDADERAIQPFEIIDVINEFTAGETNG